MGAVLFCDYLTEGQKLFLLPPLEGNSVEIWMVRSKRDLWIPSIFCAWVPNTTLKEWFLFQHHHFLAKCDCELPNVLCLKFNFTCVRECTKHFAEGWKVVAVLAWLMVVNFITQMLKPLGAISDDSCLIVIGSGFQMAASQNPTEDQWPAGLNIWCL